MSDLRDSDKTLRPGSADGDKTLRPALKAEKTLRPGEEEKTLRPEDDSKKTLRPVHSPFKVEIITPRISRSVENNNTGQR